VQSKAGAERYGHSNLRSLCQYLIALAVLVGRQTYGIVREEVDVPTNLLLP